MHNTLTRMQNTFGYLTSCAFFLALLVSTVSLLPLPLDFTPTSSQSPSAKLAVRNVQVVRGRPHYYSPKREEYAHIRFDLDADLSGLFNWNTKQVFVYVSAEYPAEGQETSIELGQDGQGGSLPLTANARPGMNKAVIWDAILPAPATPWSFTNLKQRYFPASPKGKKGATDKIKKSTSKSNRDAKTATTTDLTLPGLLTMKNQKPKYQITDPSGVIASRSNATLTLSWNVQPWVGPLLWDRGILEHKNGMEAAQGSWNLPFLKHQWRAGVMPRSANFDFPPIKGTAEKKSEGEQQVVKEKEQEGPKTPKAAGVSGVL